jgi:hypothetical protein
MEFESLKIIVAREILPVMLPECKDNTSPQFREYIPLLCARIGPILSRQRYYFWKEKFISDIGKAVNLKSIAHLLDDRKAFLQYFGITEDMLSNKENISNGLSTNPEFIELAQLVTKFMTKKIMDLLNPTEYGIVMKNVTSHIVTLCSTLQ